MATVTVSKTVNLSASSSWQREDFSAPSLPSGATMSRWKVDTNNNTPAFQKVRDCLSATDLTWNTWYNDFTLLLIGSTPRLYFRNTASSYVSQTITITIEYVIPYTPVVQGNKIKASDINQVPGQSKQVGDKITAPSGLSPGTKITADNFNQYVLGL